MKLILSLLLLLIFCLAGFSQDADFERFKVGPLKTWTAADHAAYEQWLNMRLKKPNADVFLRQTSIMNGNKITTEIHNYGSISSPGNVITDIVWNGLGYGYEFAPMIGAEVDVTSDRHIDTKIRVDANGDTTYYVHIFSDGLKTAGGEFNGDFTERWQFQPLVGNETGTIEYLNIYSSEVPTSDAPDEDQDGKPDSWPSSWYNDNLRQYVWPGALGQGATNADKEAFFIMDDRDNKEFDYYPFADDSSRKGLGIQVEARIYQWSNPLAEDAIFLIYKISNISDKDLNKVTFGMWGDPHIGGPSNYADDWAYFDKTFNMVFAYDTDGKSDIAGRPPGYLGYKFLESPGIGNEIIDGVFYSGDGIDNDNDGMIDESWTDGIDNDNDWDIDNDDVGVDGVANTGDAGEGDGMPTAGIEFDITKPGEPNFEYTDIDESDMLGLTGFSNPAFNIDVQPRDDEKLFSIYFKPNSFDTLVVQGDRVFMYSSGRFLLRKGETKRFSIALLLGEDLNDLKLNATTVQQIYNTGYQFSKPPAKPTLTAVAGDQKVKLYWNDIAERSYDPISEEEDFEGYVIYRSTTPDFSDQQTITDINGSAFLFEPLKSALGVDARFDLDNEYSGPSNVPFPGRGISYYLGNNTGIVHTYIDSNNVINGQTYFYALVAYDHGSDSLGIPPSECSKIITFDPTRNQYTFDINTVKVVPSERPAGYKPPEVVNADLNDGIVREPGTTATGRFTLKIIDETAVEDSNKYFITFSDSTGEKTFSVEDTKPKSKTFTSFYNNAVSLGARNINPFDAVVTNLSGTETYIYERDYVIDSEVGSIVVFSPDSVDGAMMEDTTDYRVYYTNYPIYHSTALAGEKTNPFFDGMELTVTESPFALRKDLTGWSESSQTNLSVQLSQKALAVEYPADYEFRFSSQIVDTSEQVSNAIYAVKAPFTIWNVTQNRRERFIIFPETVKDSTWNPGEAIFILPEPTGIGQSWSVNFTEPAADYIPPSDIDLYYIGTDKPFAGTDKFSFETKKAKINKGTAKNELDKIRVIPNPYVATNVIEPKNPRFRSQRGKRMLYFTNLPPKCTIRIFTTAGELVKTLEHDTSIFNGNEYWDLLTKDNIEIAFGLYFYHVEAPGIGEKLGKFAVIK